ncbi:hypothetical protein CYMTET_16006 [Cymbomonas tetramitiformis]|uniref:Peroxisomal biogenesis factor 11 n=1 Tax=Cymbomonas tetramitiformis TaxID=36881 RepID=A0AAE0GDB4_9CHLO|nr:hypothetical protein CYMTET_16006 [Cymbomonas tetramitiformis]
MSTIKKTDDFLKKREGIDKVLKLVRYTAKLTTYYQLRDGASSDLGISLKQLDSHLGVARKSLRIGKFIGNGLDVQKALQSENPGTVEFLKVVGGSAETIYYFLEQIMWLLKSGVLKDKELEKKLGRVETYFELTGYIAAIAIGMIQLKRLQEKETELLEDALHKKDDDFEKVAVRTTAKGEVVTRDHHECLQHIRMQRIPVILGLVQNFADASIAVGDLAGDGNVLAHPVTVSLCGLLSGCISAHGKWNT